MITQTIYRCNNTLPAKFHQKFLFFMLFSLLSLRRDDDDEKVRPIRGKPLLTPHKKKRGRTGKTGRQEKHLNFFILQHFSICISDTFSNFNVSLE
jgi:hypothetical protein